MAVKKAKQQTEQKAENISDKAKKFGSKAVSGAKEGARVVTEAAQDGRQWLRKNYYNPVFLKDYESPDYDLPKMIEIVDEDERKDIDVCEGSIGWSSKEAGLEVLHLYEEAVAVSGLLFYPVPSCDSIYYISPYDKTRFINLERYFDVVQKDKLSELAHIAHSLGAKKCQVQMYELNKTISKKSKKIGISGKKTLTPKSKVKIESTLSTGLSSEMSSERKVVLMQTFEGNAAPKRPKLQWYAHDNEIKRLIESRCAKNKLNISKEYSIEISNSASLTMSTKTALMIDAALGKLGASCNFLFEGEVMNESRQRLLFEIEF